MNYILYLTPIVLMIFGYVLYRYWYKGKDRNNDTRRMRSLQSFEKGGDSINNRMEFFFKLK